MVCAIGPMTLYQSWKYEAMEGDPRRPARVEDIRVPDWVRKFEEKRWPVLALAFFAGNVVKQLVVKSNAFEVFYNEHLLHSMLQTGRYPSFEGLSDELGTFI